MNITISPTEKIIDLEAQGFPRLARAWKGVTDAGIKCTVFVITTAVDRREDQKPFEQTLEEITPRDVEVHTLKQILD